MMAQHVLVLINQEAKLGNKPQIDNLRDDYVFLTDVFYATNTSWCRSK